MKCVLFRKGRREREREREMLRLGDKVGSEMVSSVATIGQHGVISFCKEKEEKRREEMREKEDEDEQTDGLFRFGGMFFSSTLGNA